jgi:dinuclear metal center YbgI/SA1388 family protein
MSMVMVLLKEIVDYCDNRLKIGEFKDYCPNGLQVEASREIRTIVSGVTASLALIEAATDAGADLLLVHHGYFWNSEALPLTGMKGRRIRALYEGHLSLAAYHLPLDAHPELGNNIGLGKRLGFSSSKPLTEDGLLWGTELAEPVTARILASRIKDAVDRTPLMLPGGEHEISRVAWCTGGAQSWVEKAADLGFDAFITGEVSESSFHIAAERKIHFFAAGHHATERFGVQALGVELQDKFNIKHMFMDFPNPV